MSAPETTPPTGIVSDEYRNALADKGLALYEARLKPLLEPAHNGEYIVLHVDSGDYTLGRTRYEARQAMRARRPRDGRLISMKIGPEPDDDSLAARVLLSQMREAAQK